MPVVVAVLLGPVISAMSGLCSVEDWKYMKKKGFDGSATNVTSSAILPKTNILLFPPRTPFHSSAIGDSRCKQCSCDQFVVCKENRICRFCGESGYYESHAASTLAATCTRSYNRDAAKRVAHFKMWIARLQGKERCTISQEDLANVTTRVQLYPDNLSEYDRIKLALKELQLQRYYNNIYYIMRHIWGHALVEFRKINEARLLAMFMRIQEPFSRIQDRKRTNMMSYQFLIRKFCELLGYSLAQYIPLLKSRHNLQKQDYLWKCICDELGLPFYPSV